jgi:hemerythrin-like domain-containing protein
MNDPMTILKADHRQVKKMLTTLAESEEGPERNALSAQLGKALSLHMELEEQLVYPLVEREVGEEDAEEATVEHGLARNGLATLLSLVEEPGFGAAVEMLKAGIEHHVEEEESELLPELKEKLGRDQWLGLGDSIAQGKAAAGMPVSVPKARKSQKRTSKKVVK